MEHSKKIIVTILLAVCTLCVHAANKSVKVHTFEAGKGTFLLDSKPFVVKAAELHYARIPRAYWDHRIKMCKALGMNTICAYVFWNYQEPEEGIFDFTGNHDLPAFVDLCKKNGMWVIVRPGPYACAEWEMGGLPWWLLKNKDIQLRTQDQRFLEPAIRFENKVAEILAPYRLENGGNIIMVQVENEYGSYAKDKPYVSAVRDALRKAGWGNTLMYQCDWSSNFQDNALDDLLWTMNFGTSAKVLDQFKRVKELRPDSPLMCSEYWSGWFDGWGRAHETRPADAMVKGIGTMLDNGISFSLYMTHGGTSFGWWAGANVPGYKPDCTSYDYDAPIDEQGRATDKYYQLRDLLQKYSDTKLPAIPKPIPVITIPEVKFTEMAPILRAGNLPQPSTLNPQPSTLNLQPMEQFNQGYGNIMYSTALPALKAGDLLRIKDVHDYAIVYIDNKEIGQLYRGSKNDNSTLKIPFDVKAGTKLDIYVEEMGRINYSKQINDPKGITESVEALTSDGKNDLTYNLKGWNVTLFPYSDDCQAQDLSWIPVPAEYLDPTASSTEGSADSDACPAYYRTSFNLKKTGDTYLDLSTWGKGLVWVNGHCIGRFWKVGPQQTLYLPGCWLKKGKNDIIILDIIGPSAASVKGLSKPSVDQLHKEFLPNDAIIQHPEKNDSPKTKVLGNDAAPGA